MHPTKASAAESAGRFTPTSLRGVSRDEAYLRDAGAKTVLDLGCGKGRFLRALLDDKAFEKVVGLEAPQGTHVYEVIGVEEEVGAESTTAVVN